MKTQTEEMKLKVEQIRQQELIRFTDAMNVINGLTKASMKQKLFAWSYVIKTDYHRRTKDSFYRIKALNLIQKGYIDKSGNIDKSLLN